MAYTVTNQIKIDVAKKSLSTPIISKQSDSNSRYLEISLTNNGNPITVPSDAMVLINVRRELDDKSKAFECTVTEDGAIIAALNDWMLEIGGRLTCDISVIHEESRLTSMRFVIELDGAVYSNETVSEDENTDILTILISRCTVNLKETEELLEEVVEIKTSAEKLLSAIPSEIYVTSNHRLYIKNGDAYTQLDANATAFDSISKNLAKYHFFYIGGDNPVSTGKISTLIPLSARFSSPYIYFTGLYDGGYDYAATVTGSWYRYSSSITLYIEYVYGYNSCIVEGTLINMADGTEKAVEELKAGDIIQSYDPVTETLTPAVVVDSYVTGYARDFSTFCFSDGKWVTAWGYHCIYDKRKGIVKDIRKSTRDDQVVTIDGEIVQWAATRGTIYRGEKKRRYNVISSNNLYFANGILLGHKPYSKLHHVLDARIPVSDSISKIWQFDCDTYNKFDEFLTAKEFNTEIAEVAQTRARAEHIIEVCKKKLANSDYKALKYTEGLLETADWDKAKTDRARWRDHINEQETILSDCKIRHKEIYDKYRGGITERSIFEECCARDNAIHEAVLAYFVHSHEERSGE